LSKKSNIKSQIKVLHTNIGLFNGVTVNTQKNKTELKKSFTSTVNCSNVLIGVDRIGSLYIVVRDSGKVNVNKISPTGEIEQKWDRVSLTKGLSVMTDICNYYSISNGISYRNCSNKLTRDDELDFIRRSAVKTADKYLDNKLKSIKNEIKKKAISFVKKNEFKKAKEMLSIISKDRNYDDEYHITVKDVLDGYWTSYNSGYKSKLYNQANMYDDESSIRLKVYSLAKQYSEKLSDSLLK